ncbi:hypothetical protein [Clostridium perfringens]|uniref:hypothetical protein n=1 Tax=Clostridium perfringens TaxID=1502 RepID=UPI002FCD2E2B
MINKLFLDLNNFKANLGGAERGDSIELNIKLLNSQDYSNSKFRLLGAKSDGKFVEQIEGMNLDEQSNLKIILEDQFVNCEGIVKLELNVVSGETEITTKEFYFFVSNTMNAEIIDSDDSIPTLEKVSKYVDDAVSNLDSLKEATQDITIINSEFKENEIKRKASEMLREKNEKARVNSEDIRITEEEEREANELERIQAENNRKVAENNRKLAENTRKTNEVARVEAELNRQNIFEENEEIRNENENLRIEAEKERIKFNSEAKTDELNRKESEKNRVLAEEERKVSEESRVAAEAIRQNTYTDFNESEEERKNNEIKRQEAEALRVEAETRRDNLFAEKEEERNTLFVESEKVRNAAFNKAQDSRNTAFEESETVREEAFKISEKVRNDAEELRITAESERAKAEKLRVDSEKARVLAEEERNTTFTQKEEERNNTFTQNETNRNETFEVAEEARTVAETSRIESEISRVEAETERVETENLRVTAEEERVAAEQIREEKFAGFENKIGANTKELKGARTATTGEQFNSLDERIDCEVDRLNKKIEVSMLQQEDKESHVVENSVEGMTTDMVVKGRTLFNHIGKYLTHGGCEWNNNKATVSGISLSNGYAINLECTAIDINKSYILGVYIESLNDNAKNLGFSMGVLDSTNSSWNRVVSITPVKGWNFVELTLDKNKTLGNVRFRNSKLPTDLELDIVFTNFIMIEKTNQYSFIDNPCYFKSFKSFGQQEDKISILSHNKNLVDCKFELGIWNVSPTDQEPNKQSNSNYVRSNELIDISKFNDQQISISLNGKSVEGNIKYYTKDRKYIKDVFNAPFNPVPNAFYITIHVPLSRFSKYDEFQIETGSSISSYEPYKCDKKDILLQELGFGEGLRGLNSYVYDELNSIRNVAIKRIEKHIMTGNEQLTGNLRGEYFYCSFKLEGSVPRSGAEAICNQFAYVDGLWNVDDPKVQNKEGFDLSGSDILSFQLPISKLETPNTEGIKKYFKSLHDSGNPVIVYYELSEPVETPLNESIVLKVYNEKTYVSFENSIPGTSSFKAPVDTVATIARLNRENKTLEEENVKLKENMIKQTIYFENEDKKMTDYTLDMDFKMCLMEMDIEDIKANLGGDINAKK